MIVTTKKDLPGLVKIINEAIEQAIKEWEQEKKTKYLTN